MSGHSKWSTIKHKKAKTDSARAAEFQKFSRELIVAAKLGGGDPAGNFRLRTAIEKAKAAGLPNDNIKRAIEKGCGAGSNENYEEMTYEGYAAGGVAVVIEAMTDNRNRTAGEVRHIFDKYGGNLGQTGCVSFLFDKKGLIVISNEEGELDEDTVMMDALEAGADDCEVSEDGFEILTSPASFSSVREALENKGYEFDEAEVSMIPQSYTSLSDEKQLEQIEKLIDGLEDNDDVMNVYHNWEQE
jgi:YebC/PmpR family DNA-binding regulatory protein